VSWTAKEMWFDTWQRQEIFPVPKCADQLWDPPSISLILRTPSPAVKQRNHLHLVIRLRIGMDL